LTELIKTGAVPVDVKTSDCVTGAFTTTLPKARLGEPTVRVGTIASRDKGKVLGAPPEVAAVRVAICVVLTAETAAVNEEVSEPVDTTTVGGNLTAALLLDKVTSVPPLSAADLRVTVQESVPAAAMDG